MSDTREIQVIADLEPNGSSFAWGWHDKDDFLEAWGEVTDGDGLDDGIDDYLRGIVYHGYAVEVETPFPGEVVYYWDKDPDNLRHHNAQIRKATVMDI